MKPINFRDLVFNIIAKEYERLEISPVNDNLIMVSRSVNDKFLSSYGCVI